MAVPMTYNSQLAELGGVKFLNKVPKKWQHLVCFKIFDVGLAIFEFDLNLQNQTKTKLELLITPLKTESFTRKEDACLHQTLQYPSSPRFNPCFTFRIIHL